MISKLNIPIKLYLCTLPIHLLATTFLTIPVTRGKGAWIVMVIHGIIINGSIMFSNYARTLTSFNLHEVKEKKLRKERRFS